MFTEVFLFIPTVKMNKSVNIEDSWYKILKNEFEKPYFTQLIEFVKTEYNNHVVYPKGKEIFSAFDHCSFDDTKVVILGQDPYHGEGQAHGLSFSVKDGIKPPPSLINIYKELHNDLNQPTPETGNLDAWAKQGVLLLNATLTVRKKTPGSHQNKGWEEFTDQVIHHLNTEKENLVFILWGAYAQRKGSFIDTEKHMVIKSPHPSPFSAHKGFFGSQPFSKTNTYLKDKGIAPIEW